jgi:hypothetical protein
MRGSILGSLCSPRRPEKFWYPQPPSPMGTLVLLSGGSNGRNVKLKIHHPMPKLKKILEALRTVKGVNVFIMYKLILVRENAP